MGKRRNGVPASLGAAGEQCWRELSSHWEVGPAQRSILTALCQCLDRQEDLRRILAEQGQLQADRFGILQAHPASVALAREISSFGKLFRALQLEPPSGAGKERPGRPEDWFPEEDE